MVANNSPRPAKPKLALALLTALLTLCVTPSFAAASPEDTIGGAGSKWYAGSMLQTYGTNCSTAILGSSYSEVMVNGFASYGGAPGGGAVRVGDKYWAMVTLGVPGNPCPHGSDIIPTDLVMPPGTSYDATRQIRCFSTTRHSNNWYESTNEGWNMPWINASGRTCPTGPTPSTSGYGTGFGYRGLANGQMLKIFIPVTSNQTLLGMAGSHKFQWVVSPTLSYSRDVTEVYANVFAPGNSSEPYIYFAREPSVVPFWNKAGEAGKENMAELFVNLFSNYKPGNLCYKLYAGASASGAPVLDCAGFNPAVSDQSDSWYAEGPGPNGGAVPFYFDYPADYGQTFTIQWYFAPSSGPTITSTPITFKALNGIDEDGDGVANDGADQCPTVKGTLPNGCSPALAAKVAKVSTIKRSNLKKGATIRITCSRDSKATAAVSVTKKVAKKLKLKVKKGASTVTVATAKGSCKASGGGKLKLKPTRAAKKPLARYRKSIPATLTLTVKDGTAMPFTTSSAVKLK